MNKPDELSHWTSYPLPHQTTLPNPQSNTSFPMTFYLSLLITHCIPGRLPVTQDHKHQSFAKIVFAPLIFFCQINLCILTFILKDLHYISSITQMLFLSIWMKPLYSLHCHCIHTCFWDILLQHNRKPY